MRQSIYIYTHTLYNVYVYIIQVHIPGGWETALVVVNVEKKTVMALWRRTHSYSTMNLNFPGENQKGFKGCSGIYSILLLPNDAIFYFRLCTLTSLQAFA